MAVAIAAASPCRAPQFRRVLAIRPTEALTRASVCPRVCVDRSSAAVAAIARSHRLRLCEKVGGRTCRL